jgi:hypothetical protein
LGASFERCEELTRLLQAIEERRNQSTGKTEARPKLLRVAGKGSRELKNLASTINYEDGSARNWGQRERGIIVCP